MREKKLPRGLRNCNPLNIRRSNSRWLGLNPAATDREFCQFLSMRWGWRAAFKLLCETYYARWGLHTVQNIIGRWAPPNDGNNTSQYIATVCTAIGKRGDEELPAPRENPALWQPRSGGFAIRPH